MNIILKVVSVLESRSAGFVNRHFIAVAAALVRQLPDVTCRIL
jgi:hypothetical protein